MYQQHGALLTYNVKLKCLLNGPRIDHRGNKLFGCTQWVVRQAITARFKSAVASIRPQGSICVLRALGHSCPIKLTQMNRTSAAITAKHNAFKTRLSLVLCAEYLLCTECLWHIDTLVFLRQILLLQ